MSIKWIAHDGTGIPVDYDDMIRVKRRAKGSGQSHIRFAGRWDAERSNPWEWPADSENPGDIIKYAVIRANPDAVAASEETEA